MTESVYPGAMTLIGLIITMMFFICGILTTFSPIITDAPENISYKWWLGAIGSALFTGLILALSVIFDNPL